MQVVMKVGVTIINKENIGVFFKFKRLIIEKNPITSKTLLLC
jgi:hypothetical protein